MALVTITPANVKITATTLFKSVTVGEAVDQGETLYQHPTTGDYWLASTTDADTSAVVGIALTPNVAGEDILMAYGGDVDVGGTLTVGQTYSQHSTPGGIGLESDVTTGQFKCDLGIGRTVEGVVVLKLGFLTIGEAHP